MSKVHWTPGVPVSWPSGGKRKPNVRTFLLAGWPVCGVSDRVVNGDYDQTSERALVTCGTCLRRMAVARLDTKDSNA